MDHSGSDWPKKPLGTPEAGGGGVACAPCLPASADECVGARRSTRCAVSPPGSFGRECWPVRPTCAANDTSLALSRVGVDGLALARTKRGET
jgi:hypothetical protein